MSETSVLLLLLYLGLKVLTWPLLNKDKDCKKQRIKLNNLLNSCDRWEDKVVYFDLDEKYMLSEHVGYQPRS